jgi:hypothetical protein
MIDTNKAPLLPNSKPITERDFALGALSRPDYRGDYSEMRYMSHDDIVSFDVLNKKSDFNWEFYVNGDKSHKIWFSQLNGFYLSGEDKDISACTIFPKNGAPKHIALMNVRDFWKEVEGKRYKISIDDDKYEIDRWHPKCKGRKVGEIAEYIFKALDEERYEDMKGMTKSKTLYLLKEV